MSVPLDRVLAYLRLARTENIGPVTFQRLIRVYGDADKALAALPELSARSGRKRPLKACSLSKAKAEYAATHSYPKDNADLQNAIIAQGLLLAENPTDTAPQASLFPRRNRIIAGLSLGVIVVEAAQRSGSLITARLAGDYGREVFAVPGSPVDARCHGSNNLLRDGAVLTESADDVMAVIRPLIAQTDMQAKPKGLSGPPHRPPEFDASLESEIIDLLGPVPIHIDELISLSGAPIQQILLVLLQLELAGKLTTEPGGKVSLI